MDKAEYKKQLFEAIEALTEIQKTVSRIPLVIQMVLLGVQWQLMTKEEQDYEIECVAKELERLEAQAARGK